MASSCYQTTSPTCSRPAVLSRAVISHCQACRSSPIFAGRRRTSQLFCQGWKMTRRPSGSGGYHFVSLAIVGPFTGPIMNSVKEEGTAEAGVELLACPLCYQPLSRKGIPGLNQRAISRSGFECLTCQKAYSSRNIYLDLTITANAKVYSEGRANGVELFRNPLVSYAYERGWRQNFQTAGFPGPDEELKMAQEYFRPTYGGVLLDVSCGSGLFTRRFANLDLYSAIVAVDFSESMLRQAYEYMKQDESDKKIALVRADVARMPFATGSIDAVHAGAALHCWPSPAAGVAEISRILRPGGVFVTTTFLAESSLLNRLSQVIEPNSRSSSLRYWEEAELEDLMRIGGLLNYQSVRRQAFIMLKAQKPN